MKKNYFIPETLSLSVNAQTMICASGTPTAPERVGLTNVTKTNNVAW